MSDLLILEERWPKPEVKKDILAKNPVFKPPRGPVNREVYGPKNPTFSTGIFKPTGVEPAGRLKVPTRHTN